VNQQVWNLLVLFGSVLFLVGPSAAQAVVAIEPGGCQSALDIDDLSLVATSPDRDPVGALGASGTITLGRHPSGATMVHVPAGKFLMGSTGEDRLALPRERPQRSVYLDAFWIDQDEVSNAQYARCVAAGECQPGAYANDPQYNGDALPVVGVTWAQAAAFCEWTGRALPTEAQWEKAARGVAGQPYAWGDDPVPTADVSPYGMRGTANEVWEWTADWRDEAYYTYAPTVNPTGPAEGNLRAVRGGAWSYLPPDSRVASRTALPPTYAPFVLGFRCVATGSADIQPMSMARAAVAADSPLDDAAIPSPDVLAAVAQEAGPRNFWFDGWIPYFFPSSYSPERRLPFLRRAPFVLPKMATARDSFSPMGAGARITVTTTADDMIINGNCTLREAIDAADLDQAVDACPAGTGADTILLSAGTYSLTLSGIEDDNKSGDLDVFTSLTIVGAGAQATIINANGRERAFDVFEDGALFLYDLTVRGGNAHLDSAYPYGGGVLAAGTLTLSNTIVYDNRAQFGGGLFLSGSGPYTVQDSLIRDNTAQWSGGGIYNRGTLIVTDSEIRANLASEDDSWGGGLENDSGTVELNNVLVQENIAGFNGGGIENYRGVISITAGALLSNTVVMTDSYGGGLSNYEGELAILNGVSVQGNRAGMAGAGIDNSWGADYGGELEVLNSAILSNTTTFTESFGAGISTYSTTVTLLDNTIVRGNRAGGAGGGISVMGLSIITLRGSDITHNAAWTDVGYGGGLMLWQSLGTLENTAIEHNVAGQFGGGVTLAGAEILMTGGRVAHNTALSDSLGGGLMNLSSYAVLKNVVIDDNEADSGGGIANLDSKSVISGSTVSGNRATGTGVLVLDIDAGLGGGLFTTGERDAGQIDLTGTTLSGNSAALAGGAVSISAGEAGSTVFFVNDNSITGNSAPDGAGCYNPDAVLRVGQHLTDDSGTCVPSHTFIFLPLIAK
jgi:CSLREA domain-containing protein